MLDAVGKSVEALEAFKKALLNARKFAAHGPNERSYQLLLSGCQMNMANILRTMQKEPDAQQAYSGALATLQTLVDDNPTDSQKTLAKCYNTRIANRQTVVDR